MSSPSCRRSSVLKTQISSLGFRSGDPLPWWETKQIIAPIGDRVKRDYRHGSISNWEWIFGLAPLGVLVVRGRRPAKPQVRHGAGIDPKIRTHPTATLSHRALSGQCSGAILRLTVSCLAKMNRNRSAWRLDWRSRLRPRAAEPDQKQIRPECTVPRPSEAAHGRAVAAVRRARRLTEVV